MAAAKVPDDFELITAMQKAKVRAEDFQFHQDAIAGRENGYGQRHHLGKKAHMAERMRKRDQMMSALVILLSDPVYKAQYEALGNFLSEAETATEQALTEAETILTDAQEAFQNTEESANALPGGIKVFRAADGRIMDEHGNVLSAEDAAGIVWKDGAPSFEEYMAAKQRAEGAQRFVDDIRRYQTTVLGRARDRWEDKDNPITPDEMEEWKLRIEREMPDVKQTNAEQFEIAQDDLSSKPTNFAKPSIPDGLSS